MVFNNTEWKYSNETGMEPIEEGNRYLKIVDSKYDEDRDSYSIICQDLSSERNTTFTLTYWLTQRDSGLPNTPVRAALVTLGAALAGHPIGVPNYESVKGGVVIGEILADKSGKYRRCYKFMPAPKDIVDGFSDIEQYSVVTDESQDASNPDAVAGQNL